MKKPFAKQGAKATSLGFGATCTTNSCLFLKIAFSTCKQNIPSEELNLKHPRDVPRGQSDLQIQIE